MKLGNTFQGYKRESDWLQKTVRTLALTVNEMKSPLTWAEKQDDMIYALKNMHVICIYWEGLAQET